jgi:hypothetical protein
VHRSVAGRLLTAALPVVADGQIDGRDGRPLMPLSGLHVDARRVGWEQAAVPASGDPVTVDAPVSVQARGGGLLPVPVRADAQHQSDGRGVIEIELQSGARIATAKRPAPDDDVRCQ